MEQDYLQTRVGRLSVVRAGAQDAESVSAVMRDAAEDWHVWTAWRTTQDSAPTTVARVTAIWE